MTIDYAVAYKARIRNETTKVYILVITNFFTLAVNLKLSIELTTAEFLKSFQLHFHEYGVPKFVLSDLGSQIVAGADVISSFLSKPATVKYLQENCSRLIMLHHCYKGHHKPGSMVEICVRATKMLISDSIRNNVLSQRDFEFLISQTVHLINRRPIAFQERLRDTSSNELPQSITPELLLHG